MLNQILIYLVLSILVITLSKYTNGIIDITNWIQIHGHVILAPGFKLLKLNHDAQALIILFFTPVVVTVIISLLYRLMVNKKMPYFFTLTWSIWLVIGLSHLLAY